MKRIFALTLALLLVFSLFACGKVAEVTRDSKKDSKKPSKTPAVTTEPETLPPVYTYPTADDTDTDISLDLELPSEPLAPTAPTESGSDTVINVDDLILESTHP